MPFPNLAIFDQGKWIPIASIEQIPLGTIFRWNYTTLPFTYDTKAQHHMPYVPHHPSDPARPTKAELDQEQRDLDLKELHDRIAALNEENEKLMERINQAEETLRDSFAKAAVTGFCANINCYPTTPTHFANLAANSYCVAEAMLAIRKQ